MSRNGSGTYSLPSGNPVSSGDTISSTWANNTLDDIASALTASLVADGQKAMAADFDMGSNQINSLADGSLDDDAMAFGQKYHPNLIINGNFAINQRNYSSAGALDANDFGHDCWYSTTASSGYTFTQSQPFTTITLTGTLAQKINGEDIEGGTYTLSWTGTAQAKINSGSYADSPQTVTGISAGSDITITFDSGTIGKVQFEKGSSATPFNLRPRAEELDRCLYYYQVGTASWAGDSTSGVDYYLTVRFRRYMAGTPTVVSSNALANNFPTGGGGTVSNESAGGFSVHKTCNVTGTGSYYFVTYTATVVI